MGDCIVYQARGVVWFGKNSAGEASQPQVVEQHHLRRGSPVTRATYLEVPAPEHRLAMILSRREAVWGAEMGVNQHGVAIGCQAVFTRLARRRGGGLLGADLVRLALEQARSSRDARDIITDYLTGFGQRGASGWRSGDTRHDSGFLIADFHEAWLLETAGRFWAARRVKGYAAASNDLSIGEHFDLGAPEMEEYARDKGWAKPGAPFNFREAFRQPLRPWMLKAGCRREESLRQLAALDPALEPRAEDFIALLRHHVEGPPGKGPPGKGRPGKGRPGGSADLCLHAGGLLRPRTTMNSMIARVGFKGLPQVWCSWGRPCEHDYRLVSFSGQGALERA
jgi:dipeptidase